MQVFARYLDAVQYETTPTVLADFLMMLFDIYWCLIDVFHVFWFALDFYLNYKNWNLIVVLWHHLIRSQSTLCYFSDVSAHIYANYFSTVFSLLVFDIIKYFQWINIFICCLFKQMWFILGNQVHKQSSEFGIRKELVSVQPMAFFSARRT